MSLCKRIGVHGVLLHYLGQFKARESISTSRRPDVCQASDIDKLKCQGGDINDLYGYIGVLQAREGILCELNVKEAIYLCLSLTSWRASYYIDELEDMKSI